LKSPSPIFTVTIFDIRDTIAAAVVALSGQIP
jgi:hypothetical protein